MTRKKEVPSGAKPASKASPRAKAKNGLTKETDKEGVLDLRQRVDAARRKVLDYLDAEAVVGPLNQFDIPETPRHREWSPADGDGPRITVEYVMPHNSHEFALAQKAQGMYQVLCDLDRDLRSSIKYGEDFNGVSVRSTEGALEAGLFGGPQYPPDPSKRDMLEAVREYLREALSSRGINLDELES